MGEGKEPTRITPCGDRVVVLCDPVPDRVGKILLGPKPLLSDRGTVIAMGAGRYLEDLPGVRYCCDAAVGDRVLFPHHAGTDLRVGGNLYRILRSRDILGVLEEVTVDGEKEDGGAEGAGGEVPGGLRGDEGGAAAT